MKKNRGQQDRKPKPHDRGPCPYCYASEQGMILRTGGKPVADLRAMACSHEPACLVRELAQYPPRVLGSAKWHEYLARFVETLPEGLAPTMRAKLLIEEATTAQKVLERAELLVEPSDALSALEDACGVIADAMEENCDLDAWAKRCIDHEVPFEADDGSCKDKEATAKDLVEHFLRNGRRD